MCIACRQDHYPVINRRFLLTGKTKFCYTIKTMTIDRIKVHIEQLEEAVGALESVVDAIELEAQEGQYDMFQAQAHIANDVDKEALIQHLDQAIYKVERLLQENTG